MSRIFKRALTPKQKDILDFITAYSTRSGYAPSLIEIGKQFDLAVSTVHQHLEALKTKGYLKKEDNQPRGVSIFESKPDTAEIPLLGYIAAGQPIEPLENPEPIKVPKSMISKRGDYFALKVQGDSMIDDGIWDNDVVIIKSQQTANDKEVVVAITENGATLKILRTNNGTPYLEPRNRKMGNIYPLQLIVKGKMIGLVRSLK